VYDDFAAPVVAAALDAGVNGAVLVYGQTGSGASRITALARLIIAC
jgi:Tfp pilus assembly pilus retraction ATPase PilT